MFSHKEFSFLSLDLCCIAQSIQQNSFKRTTLMSLYVRLEQKVLLKEENMKIYI